MGIDSNLGAYEKDVEFNEVGAKALGVELGKLKESIKTAGTDRAEALSKVGWQGDAVKAYIKRLERGLTDGAMLMHHVGNAVKQVELLIKQAKAENTRRAEARAWVARLTHYRNNDSVWDSFKDAIGAEPNWEEIEAIGPMPGPPADAPNMTFDSPDLYGRPEAPVSQLA